MKARKSPRRKRLIPRRDGSNKASQKKLIRGGISRGERYRQQPRRRIQISQRRLILVVRLVANLAGIVAGLAVALVLALASGRRGCHLLAVGRTTVQASGRGQYRDGQEPIHPAANHGYRDNLSDYLIGSIRRRCPLQKKAGQAAVLSIRLLN